MVNNGIKNHGQLDLAMVFIVFIYEFIDIDAPISVQFAHARFEYTSYNCKYAIICTKMRKTVN